LFCRVVRDAATVCDRFLGFDAVEPIFTAEESRDRNGGISGVEKCPCELQAFCARGAPIYRSALAD
jgi:hypothetical protein